MKLPLDSSSNENASVERIINVFVKLFGEFIKNNPEIKELIERESSVAKHDQKMKTHLRKIYNQIPRSESLELSNRVGISHIDHNVRLSWYLTGYNRIFEAYHIVQNDHDTDLPDLGDFRKCWQQDAGDTLDSYYNLIMVQHASENTSLQRSIKELDLQAKTDPLTEILNRRGLREAIDADESDGVFAIFDLDKFKSINDQHGHVTGDEVLRQIAKGLSSHLRKGDLLGRIGGDEFAIWLPSASPPSADEIAHTIKRMIRGVSFEMLKIAISGGYTRRTENMHDFDELYAQADAALYKAKSLGHFTICEYGNDTGFDIRP